MELVMASAYQARSPPLKREGFPAILSRGTRGGGGELEGGVVAREPLDQDSPFSGVFSVGHLHFSIEVARVLVGGGRAGVQ